jgi:hypothetical protein
MRYTPYLDSHGIKFEEHVPDSVVNIIDAAFAHIERTIEWGEHEGKRRKPCVGQPLLLAGAPLGQYHCEFCGEMQLAGTPHLPPDDDYETVIGQPWPAGYEEVSA